MKGFVLVALPVFLLFSIAVPLKAHSEETTPDEKAKPVEALLDEVESNLAGIASLRADFLQEKRVSILKDVLKTEGTLLFKRPGSVRLETRKPFRSVLVKSGDSSARYESLQGKWTKLDAGDSRAAALVAEEIGNWIQGRFDASGKSFSISAEFGEETTIVLRPKNARLAKMISAVRLVLNEKRTALTAVKIEEPDGDYTLMSFVNETRNEQLDDALFDTTLDVPESLPENPAGGGDAVDAR